MMLFVELASIINSLSLLANQVNQGLARLIAGGFPKKAHSFLIWKSGKSFRDYERNKESINYSHF